MSEAASPQISQSTAPNVTEWAKKYGVADDEWAEDIGDLGKSGFTPVTLEDLNNPYLESSDVILHHSVRKYQRRYLAGFTSEELLHLGAMSNDDLELCILRPNIHPLFAKSRWATDTDRATDYMQNLALPYGKDGRWHVGNDVVWNALVPCLHLASLLLTHVELSPW